MTREGGAPKSTASPQVKSFWDPDDAMRRYTDRPPNTYFWPRKHGRGVGGPGEGPRGKERAGAAARAGRGRRRRARGVGGRRPGLKRDSYWILERMWSAL
jgi:hypothetical protein